MNDRKCLKHGMFLSVELLQEAIEEFIHTWNTFFAHPFTWSYTGEGLHEKAVRRFSKLLLIESRQMDSKFLTSQLTLSPAARLCEDRLHHENHSMRQ